MHATFLIVSHVQANLTSSVPLHGLLGWYHCLCLVCPHEGSLMSSMQRFQQPSTGMQQSHAKCIFPQLYEEHWSGTSWTNVESTSTMTRGFIPPHTNSQRFNSSQKGAGTSEAAIQMCVNVCPKWKQHPCDKVIVKMKVAVCILFTFELIFQAHKCRYYHRLAVPACPAARWKAEEMTIAFV